MLELPSKRVGETGGAMTEFYEQPLPIRTYDIDFAGIVSNIVFIAGLRILRLGRWTRPIR
jgi:hypothetical protein